MQVKSRCPSLPVACLHSQLPREETSSILKRMIFPSTNEDTLLLYVTPERLAKSKLFMTKLQKCWELKKLKLIAIDEVRANSKQLVHIDHHEQFSPASKQNGGQFFLICFSRSIAVLNGDTISGLTTLTLAFLRSNSLVCQCSVLRPPPRGHWHPM